MNLIQQLIQNNNLLILDGALGTQLQKKGYDVNDSLWSAKFLKEDPTVIAKVHEEYLEAGADCIITSTYQASIEGFLEKGFSKEEAKELLQLSVKIAQETRDEFWQKCEDKQNRIKPLVACSIGPYGAYLADGSEYSGRYEISKEQLKEFHKKRLEILIETKPDILACETIPSLQEAKIICELIQELSNIPAWVSFSAQDEKSINSGDSIKSCFEYLQTQEHISAVGINCTAPQYIPSLIEAIKKQTKKPIVVYPNSGYTYNPVTKKWEDSDLEAKEFAKMAHLWYKSGAKLIGGCCQTGPEEISCIRQLLK